VKYVYSDVRRRLDVHEDLAVFGTLESGAVIDEGCALYVEGRIDGTLRIGVGAQVVLGGYLHGFVDENLGTLAVAGVITTPLETIPGRLTVATYSSVVVRGTTSFLVPDAARESLLDLPAATHGGSGAVRWTPASATFSSESTDAFDRLASIVEHAHRAR
jgi:hypothetical protein